MVVVNNSIKSNILAATEVLLSDPKAPGVVQFNKTSISSIACLIDELPFYSVNFILSILFLTLYPN